MSRVSSLWQDEKDPTSPQSLRFLNLFPSHLAPHRLCSFQAGLLYSLPPERPRSIWAGVLPSLSPTWNVLPSSWTEGSWPMKLDPPVPSSAVVSLMRETNRAGQKGD